MTDPNDDSRPALQSAQELVCRLAEGDYSARAAPIDTDSLDGALLIELNLLAERLQARDADSQQAMWVQAAQARHVARSEACFRALAANADALAVVDSMGCVVFSNAAADTLMGMPLLGERWPEATLALPPAGRVEVSRELPSGLSVVLEARVAPIDWERSTARLVVLADVSERRRLQSDLQNAQRLGLVARLASGVAHDFNNLLATIIGNLDIIDQLQDLEAARRPLAAIADSAARAARLTSRLLAVGRRRVGMPTPVDVPEVINQMHGLLEQILGSRAHLEVLHESPGLVILADPVQLEQIVLNLVTNARDAIPNEGRIALRTAQVLPDEPLPCGCTFPREGRIMAMIEVRDDGEGIPPEHLTRIFDPFFSTRDEGIGTGLGLPTVQGIVERSNGHVCAASAVGQGTTLRVYLPLMEPVVEGATQPVASPRSTSFDPLVPQLLIVDDEQGIREALVHCFRNAGYRVLDAANGDEALGLAASSRRPIDLLVTDILMPGMDGWELSQALYQTQPDMKTLFISGFGEQALSRHRIEGAPIEFLAKPFRLATILSRVAALVPRTP